MNYRKICLRFGAKALSPALTALAAVLTLAAAGMMLPGTASAEIGTIKPVPFTPTPSGNGRAVAFDGGTTLYYTFVGDTNIYRASTSGVSLGAIPNPGRDFTCGALSFDGMDLWCGTYDGTGDVWTVDPVIGAAVFRFNDAAFGGFQPTNCFGQATDFIDGLAFDPSDNTLWISDDGDVTLYHVTLAGTLIASYSTPVRPSAAAPGCNSGIEVVPGGFLELVLLGPTTGVNDGGPDPNSYIVKVPKADPSGALVVAFQTQDPLCCEDLSFDAKTFAPRAVLWANGPNNQIKAYDVQVTRTIGYWKNHAPEDFDGTSFLPIDLGDDGMGGVCETVLDAGQVTDIMRAHRGQDAAPKLRAQLLAAKLNVSIGDVPAADLAAVAPVIADADLLLGRNGCMPDTGKQGADRAEALDLSSQLDDFNNRYSP